MAMPKKLTTYPAALNIRIKAKQRGLVNAISKATGVPVGAVIRRALDRYAKGLHGAEGKAARDYLDEWEAFRRELARPS
jgi:hypothetical protein